MVPRSFSLDGLIHSDKGVDGVGRHLRNTLQIWPGGRRVLVQAHTTKSALRKRKPRQDGVPLFRHGYPGPDYRYAMG